MSRTFLQEGHALDFVATAAVTSSTPLLVGNVLVVPNTSAAIGENFSGSIDQVHNLPAATGAGQDWTGSCAHTLYWDDTAKVVTRTVAANKKIGVSAGAKAVGVATGPVLLIPQA